MPKEIFKKYVPDGAWQKAKKLHAFTNINISKLHVIFSQNSPEWLEKDELSYLQNRYSSHSDAMTAAFRYDKEGRTERSEERADEILDFIKEQNISCSSFLDIGCGDGTNAYALARNGKKVWGIDIVLNIHETVPSDHVIYKKMNAADLNFKDNTFECVYSFDSFEHIGAPEKAFSEALRVTKRGGLVYLKFGPLYYSPYGAHAYYSVKMPYCTLLFDEALLTEYIRKKGLPEVDFVNYVNKYTIDEFRSIFNRYKNQFKTLHYQEKVDVQHLDIINRYPSCFKSKKINFENLIVSEILLAIQKI